MSRALGVQLTELCAPGCAVCGPRSKARSLTAEGFERATIEARALKIDRVVLTGGEPFVHESLDEIVEVALAVGIEVEIVSTGHRLEQRSPALRRLGSKLVRLWSEFHGGTAATHERVTGRQGSFQEARAVLDVARELRVPRGARLIPTTESLREVDPWRAAVSRFEAELVIDRSSSHLPAAACELADERNERCGDAESSIVAVVAASGRVFPCFASLGARAVAEESVPLLEERLRPILEEVSRLSQKKRCTGCRAGFAKSFAALG